MTVPMWLMIGLIFFVITVFKLSGGKLGPVDSPAIMAAVIFMVLGPLSIFPATAILKDSND